MDVAPWELGVNEKSKPKLNTVGMQCQRRDIAQWLQTSWSLLQSLQHNLCVSQVPGCAVIFQIQATFGSCGDASMFALPFSPAFSLTIAKVWPLMASFILYGDVCLYQFGDTVSGLSHHLCAAVIWAKVGDNEGYTVLHVITGLLAF